MLKSNLLDGDNIIMCCYIDFGTSCGGGRVQKTDDNM